jgi:putative addiction module component (TIGR02574 family)
MTPMSMTVDQVIAETKSWPEEQVETLFERFLLANYRLPAPELDPAWAAEIKRRVEDMESGREIGIPGDEVMARVRKIVGL